MTDYKEILIELQETDSFHRALEHIDKEEDMNLYAEIERLAFTQDMLSNYRDRLIDQLVKEVNEE